MFTAPVGHYEPNDWGLYDMHGNAWEWCFDHYNAEFYKKAKALTLDPDGPAAASGRVFHGGGWDGTGWDCRSASRHKNSPRFQKSNLGFRVARVPSEP